MARQRRFRAHSDDDVRPEFREAGLVDAKGVHRVFGANVEIVLTDIKRLGNRPLPKTWADILHPQFKGDIIISGEEGDIHESFLFGLHKDHGEAALTALGANVRTFMHPAEMAKTAGSANPKGAALYILPWFFAKSAPHREATQVVWPEEGAYLSPLYLFRKRNARPEAKLASGFSLWGNVGRASRQDRPRASAHRFANVAGKTALARLGLRAKPRP
jgi:ABC-type Fe3+ transport system substrate-binding protein